MVYFTGDIHRYVNKLLRNLEYLNIPHESNQIIVLLGDVGINYMLDMSDKVEKEKLQSSGRTYFCIQGNHELRPENIDSYKIKEWNGGKVYIEDDYPNLIFAKDGEVYCIDGKSYLVLGGAYSVDKYYRLMMGHRWFKDEQIALEHRPQLMSKIKQIKEVDIVLSHTCPAQWQPTDLFLDGLDQSTVDNTMEEWLSDVEKNLNYKHWLFGHFHANRKINDKATMLYGKIISINDLMEET